MSPSNPWVAERSVSVVAVLTSGRWKKISIGVSRLIGWATAGTGERDLAYPLAAVQMGLIYAS